MVRTTKRDDRNRRVSNYLSKSINHLLEGFILQVEARLSTEILNEGQSLAHKVFNAADGGFT